MAQVKIIGLNKAYENGVVALDHVDLDIRSGEFLVLVGPSGCGKSTLLRSIAGLETPSFGTIEIDRVRVNDLRPADRNIGMVFQDYALYPHMNVRENLAFGLKMRRMEKAEIQRRIEEVARMLELSELLPRKPAQLSGGQRQRVAIGRALVKRPQVLLLDEPLSNLDAQLRAQTRVEIAALHRRIGSTTIYVTHDQEEAMVLADRIVVLNRGKVQQIGPPLELYQKPINRFVASFIGSPQMNFLDGLLQQAGSGFFFETESQRLPLPAGTHPARHGPYALGFRPEAFRGIDDQGLAATLTWIELHGHEIHVVAKIGKQRITLRTGDAGMISTLRAIAPQERFHIDLDPKALHWFEASPRGVRISI